MKTTWQLIKRGQGCSLLVASVLALTSWPDDGWSQVHVVNQTAPDSCAEHDNVQYAFSGSVASFVIQATHPGYVVGVDNCDPNFDNCPASIDPVYSFAPGVFKLFDDHVTVVEAVRTATYWRPSGMVASVDDGAPIGDIQFIRVYRKIADANEYPQFFVLYSDGNLRLVPHPPLGVGSVCFGSSVVVGPETTLSGRPIAEIASVRYNSASKTLSIVYKAGGSAVMDLGDVNRTRSRVRVSVNYATAGVPFAVFRSMFVAADNCDAARVNFTDLSVVAHDDDVVGSGGGDSSNWFFYRPIRSQHNTSAPDIRLEFPAWHSTQLTSIANAAGGSRTGAAHSSAYLYFYKGIDDNIWGSFWNGTQWVQSPLTSDGNVDDWLSFGTTHNLLCYKGRDNRLWVLYFNGSVWVPGTLGTTANVAGDLVMDDTWNLIHYRATDGRVWTTWWNGGQWMQTSLGGTANVLGGLAVDSRHHLIYYLGSGNQMWSYYWTGTAWVQSMLGSTSNVSGAVAADSGGGMAYYRSSSDNTMWAVYWNGTAWGQTQIDATAGMGATSSMATFTSSHVALYINSAGRCCGELWTGSNWGNGILGDGGSGLTGGLCVQRSGNLIFARRNDGHLMIFYYQ